MRVDYADFGLKEEGAFLVEMEYKPGILFFGARSRDLLLGNDDDGEVISERKG